MDAWTGRLSEYLDDELAGAEREAAERHLAGCAECASALEELRAVTVTARGLEDRPPATDLWPGIEARLGPRRTSIVSLLGRLGSVRARFEVTVPQLAAAGLLLVALSGGGVWLTMRGATPRGEQALASRPGAARESDAPLAETGSRAPAAPRSAFVPRGVEGANAAYAAFDEERYDAAIAELKRALREHGSELDTTTVRILQQNLETIDRAIEQARLALAADPANPYLNDHLAEQLMLKVRLLQRATEVVAAHG